jgi:photosystem II stability/assembly factor-like uncharacterized protein
MPISCRALLASLVIAAPLAAQQRSPAPAAFKGVWEPVSFSEDLDFREVFFVTIDKGWVAGEKGTIIHTTDGGATWTAQLGGDPEAAEKPVKLLRFVDETHGWAVRDGRVLRTEDGEAWEDLGAAPDYMHELVMTSPTDGVGAGFVGVGTVPSTLFKTSDGGKTWRPVTTCEFKAMLGGLSREIRCEVLKVQFVTPTTGYLVARRHCVGAGCDAPPIMGKTEDGGESWHFFMGPGNTEVVGATDLFFTDENTGFVRTTDGKLAQTTDGGTTWKGLLASVGSHGTLIFADPEVGWALEEYKVSYTTDGGRRWNSRPLQFPTHYRNWSFPRRDRAYVVGANGMVFRYRVVPASEPMAAGGRPGPAMPAFESPLDEQVPELEGFVQDLNTAVDQAPDAAAQGAGTPGGGFSQDASAPSPFIASCCGEKVNRLDAVLGLVLESLPQFVTRFKNTNLLTAGLRMLATMPTQLGDVTGAFQEFKRATNKEGARAALARLLASVGSLRQSTRAAFQQEATP